VKVGLVTPVVVVAALTEIFELEMLALDRITEVVPIMLVEAGSGKTVAVERRISGVDVSVEHDVLVEGVLLEDVLVVFFPLLRVDETSPSQSSSLSRRSWCLPSFLSCSEHWCLCRRCLPEPPAGERSAATMTAKKTQRSISIRMVVRDLVGKQVRHWLYPNEYGNGFA